MQRGGVEVHGGPVGVAAREQLEAHDPGRVDVGLVAVGARADLRGKVHGGPRGAAHGGVASLVPAGYSNGRGGGGGGKGKRMARGRGKGGNQIIRRKCRK